MEVFCSIAALTSGAITAPHCAFQLWRHKSAITAPLLQIPSSPLLSSLSLIHLNTFCLSSSSSVSERDFFFLPPVTAHTAKIHMSSYTSLTSRFLVHAEMHITHTFSAAFGHANPRAFIFHKPPNRDTETSPGGSLGLRQINTHASSTRSHTSARVFFAANKRKRHKNLSMCTPETTQKG